MMRWDNNTTHYLKRVQKIMTFLINYQQNAFFITNKIIKKANISLIEGNKLVAVYNEAMQIE